MDKFNQIRLINEELKVLTEEYWFTEVVFTIQWWIIIITTLTPFILLWKFADKRKSKDLAIVGITIALLSFFLDQIGASLTLWDYPYTATPLAREILDPADFAILPVSYMFLYQWFPNWKSYIVVQIVFGFVAAFIGGSFFQWFGIYHTLQWKHIYSVPIYIAMGILIKLFVQLLNQMDSNAYR